MAGRQCQELLAMGIEERVAIPALRRRRLLCAYGALMVKRQTAVRC
jgi:hypothetical protein